MDRLIIIYILTLIFFTCFLNWFNGRFLKIKLLEKNRDIPIDGIRGYLALNVMVHHYYIFYIWTKTGEWTDPDLTYMKNLGHASVFIFFMITGYLFIGKIRRCISGNIIPSWIDIYISRVFRIVPLYFFVIGLTILIYFIEHGWVVRIEKIDVAKELIKWGMFIGSSVNGDENARLIHAGVTWTLRYEWLFYISLPIIFITLRSKLITFILSIAVVAFFFKSYNLPFFSTKYFVLFAAGGWIGWAKDNLNLNNLKSSIVSFISLFVFLLCVIFDDTQSESYLTFSSMLVFLIVACGNDFFGVLSKPSSRLMGEVSYSIYLLHGIVIYVAFKLFILKFFTTPEWVYVYLFVPVSALVLLLSMITFKNIEHPAYMFGKKISIRRKGCL